MKCTLFEKNQTGSSKFGQEKEKTITISKELYDVYISMTPQYAGMRHSRCLDDNKPLGKKQRTQKHNVINITLRDNLK